MFHRILVATDGSEHAGRALREAIDLAKCNNARLTVMTVAVKPSTLVVGGPVVPPLDFGALEEAIEAEHRKLLDAAIDEVPQEISVERLLAHGSPAKAILEEARTGRHDLIVLGSRGEATWARCCSAASATGSCTTAGFPCSSSTRTGRRGEPRTRVVGYALRQAR